jgi:hypothetical protein
VLFIASVSKSSPESRHFLFSASKSKSITEREWGVGRAMGWKKSIKVRVGSIHTRNNL